MSSPLSLCHHLSRRETSWTHEDLAHIKSRSDVTQPSVSALALCPLFVWTRRCSSARLKSGPTNPPLFCSCTTHTSGEYHKKSSVISLEKKPPSIISSSSTRRGPSLMCTSAHFIAADALQCITPVFFFHGFPFDPTSLPSPSSCHSLSASEVSTIDVLTEHEPLHA